MIDLISFSFCWLPNYIVDISQPFVSQEKLRTKPHFTSSLPRYTSSHQKNDIQAIAKWIFEKIIMSWLIYTARILVVTYFTISPFFYFFYFGILSKRYGNQNSRKLLFGRYSSGIGRKMSDALISNFQYKLNSSNVPKSGEQPTNIIVNNTAIVHMPVKIGHP